MTESDTPETTIPESDAPEAAAEVATATTSVAVETEAPAPVVRAAPKNVDARNPIWTVGRRKSSTARIRMFPGGGNFVVNGKPLDEYFRLVKDQHDATLPLGIADVRKKYDIWVNVDGGGMTGQSGAIALGVSRALAILEPTSEQALRDAGMMRRDARVKERKKYGRRGARRGFQFSKR